MNGAGDQLIPENDICFYPHSSRNPPVISPDSRGRHETRAWRGRSQGAHVERHGRMHLSL